MPHRFHDAALHAPVGIYAIDAKGRCTYVNPKLCELLGISRRVALGLGWLKAVHPGDMDRVERERRRGLTRRGTFELRYRVLIGRKSKWVAATSFPFYDKDGHFQGRIGVLSGIDEVKNARRLMRREQARMRRAVERSPVAVLALGGSARSSVALSPQEWRVLAVVSEGRTNREAAAELGLSEKTVKNYLSTVFQKLAVRRRTEAAVIFTKLQERRADRDA